MRTSCGSDIRDSFDDADRAGDRDLVDGGEGGWTFIETLIVIGIIMILTATVGFMAFRYLDKAKTVSARSQIESFCLALESYCLDCGAYPAQEQNLAALWSAPSSGSPAAGWKGPYIAKPVPADPWGTPYEYRIPGPNGLSFGIRSFGADGKEGGEGIDADISSWEN
jgi:general secretion pathway protein G